MKSKTVLELVNRLNEIMVEQHNMDIKSIQLEKEYNEIVYELWSRIPSLTEDTNIQPKKRVRIKNDSNV